jgi:hypothetical protein
MRTCVYRGLAPISALFLFAMCKSAEAQVITCLQAPRAAYGEPCKIERQGPAQLVAVLVTAANQAAKGAVVTFSSPLLAEARKAVTDSLGVAEVVWPISPDIDSADIEIKADAKWLGVHAERTIVLVLPRPSSRIALPKALRASGDSQAWYAGKQLPHPITVHIDTLTNECERAIVVFKAIGDDAAAYPDSARAIRKGTDCIALTQWKLGKTVGDQSMRATLVGDAQHPQLFHAKARATPWMAAGLAISWLPKLDVVSSKSETLQIVTKSAAAETTFTVTRSVAKPTKSNRSQFQPILGINTPILTSWDWIRWTVAADAQHVTTDWFTGFSLTQIAPRIYNEDIGVDVDFLLHVARRDVLDDVVACNAPTPVCNTHKRTVFGVGAAVEFNASAFLSQVLGWFPTK